MERLDNFNIHANSVLHLVIRTGGSEATFAVIDETLLDPGYDYDFTGIKDGVVFYRGGEPYRRPCGWYRVALRVLGQFADGHLSPSSTPE